MRKIYVVGGSTHYANWMQGTVVQKMEDANLVVFTGGEDVDPSLYQQPRHKTTGSNIARDKSEWKQFLRAQHLGIPCIGICRGSQFLCVMNEGDLVQHQNNPAYLHLIKTYDGHSLQITSTHHQAAFPFVLPPENYKILGWTENMLPFHQDGEGKELNPPKECEIVYYPKTMCLGIQGHPESMENSDPVIPWLQKLLDKFMNKEL